MGRMGSIRSIIPIVAHIDISGFVWSDVHCNYIRLFVCFFLSINSIRLKRRFTPYCSLQQCDAQIQGMPSYLQEPASSRPSLHTLIHPYTPPPRPVTPLIRKHLLGITHLPALTNLPTNLPRQLQLHRLHSQHARGPRTISTRTTARQSLGTGSDEFALCPSVPHDG